MKDRLSKGPAGTLPYFAATEAGDPSGKKSYQTRLPGTFNPTDALARNLAIANRLREVLLNGKWIANTNFKEQVFSVSWEQAIQKVDILNTIALLTFHINYCLAGILNVLKADTLKLETNTVLTFRKLSQKKIGIN